MRAWVVLLTWIAFAGEANAGDAKAPSDAKARIAAMEKMFAAQTKAWLAGDKAAYQATLTSDALTGIVGGLNKNFFMLARPTKLEVRTKKLGWGGGWGWIAAELRLTTPDDETKKSVVTVRHYTAFVVPDGDGVKTRLLELEFVKPDSELDATEEVVAAETPDAKVALLAQPATLAKNLSKDPATSVVGSAERDRGYGRAAAAKLLGGWSKLSLEIADTTAPHYKSLYTPVVVTAGDGVAIWARLRMKLPKGKEWVDITGFLIGKQIGDRIEVVALSYGVN